MRKPHACGGNEWTVVRTGMDIRIRCAQCGRSVLMSRPQFLGAAKKLIPPEKEAGGQQGTGQSDAP